MKGGTVKSNKGKSSFRGTGQAKSFGAPSGGGWQGGMGKKSILTQLKKVEKKSTSDDEQ